MRLWIGTLLVLLLLTLPRPGHPSLERNDDPYKILGVPRNAKTSEIKSAYRKKARDTHPDKNPDQDPDEAALQFRKVVDAFEVLSDYNSRRNYDRTGRTTGGGGGGGQRWSHSSRGSTTTTWTFTFRNGQFHASSGGSGGGGRQQQYHRPRPKPQRLKDSPKVREAQSRVMHVISLSQLRTVMLDDDGKVERSLLMCFVTPGDVESLAEDDIVFPYPFAGMSAQKIWWEDILQTVQVKYDGGSSDLSSFFGLPSGGELSEPHFVFVKKGRPLSDYTKFATSDRAAFEDWVWRQLHINVEFVNNHTHPVELYWLDGNRATLKSRIPPGATHFERTMLSHEFWARDDRVDRQPDAPSRTRLNENSSLGRWKLLTDDAERQMIYIESRCADMSGHCEYWSKLGECGKNPGFMLESCRRSCNTCENEEGNRRRARDGDEL